MCRLTLLFVATLGLQHGFAQNGRINFPRKYSKLTTELGVGTRLVSVIGSPNVQLSNLLQYHVSNRVFLASQTGYYHNVPNSRVADVSQNYSFSIFQRLGAGFSLSKKRNSSAILFLAGLKHDAYSGILKNDQFYENITTESKSTRIDYGIMYSLRLGRKKYFMSSKLYVPLKDGFYGIMECATVDLGVGFRLR